jgi:hypothetical protein
MIGKTFVSRMGTRAKVVRVEKNKKSEMVHMELENGFKFITNINSFKQDWNEGTD